VDNNDTITFEDYDAALSAVLLARKKELNINFLEIALISGIKYQQVMRLMNGKRPMQFSEMVALCRALDLPVQEAARLTEEFVANTSS